MIDAQIDRIIRKIRHFLLSQFGKVLEEASKEEFYHAFCFAFREEIMINWSANLHTIEKNQCKIIYYLSMEYLPGKITGSTLSNIGAIALVKEILKRTNRNLPDLYNCEPDPGLGNGGLGRLSSCLLESLASQQYPAFGYGLRYQYGIFEQEIWNGVQIERPDCWLLYENPWEFRRDLEETFVHFGGNTIAATNSHGDQIEQLENFEEVRALPYDMPIVGYPKEKSFSVVTQRLWSTKESPRNFELQRYNAGELGLAGENTSLTDVLYPNDNHEIGKRTRLKQEFLLVSASIRDILRRHIKIYGDLKNLPEKAAIQINDTHPSLAIVELLRSLNKNHNIPFYEALEITRACCNYTNHTIMKEALIEWNEERMQELLPRQYHIIQKLNELFCKEVQKAFPEDENTLKKVSFIAEGQIRMANLSIFGSHKVNGVAKLHTEILKKFLFKEFHQLYPEKFLSVTNGVTHRRWLLYANPSLTAFITKRIGEDWLKDFSQIKNLKEFASDENSQREFLEIKKKNKETLLDFLSKENPLRGLKGKILSQPLLLSSDALFDVQVKRMHEYKRQLMFLLHLIMVMLEIKKDPQSKRIKRLAILGGKAAPGYKKAKQVIRLANALARKLREDPATKERLLLIFVENYNVSKAQLIIPAADLSEQISMAGMEASGTGNMKLAMNGALTIATEDGSNIELKASITEKWWPFTFGATADQIREAKKNYTYSPYEIYKEDKQIKEALDTLHDGTFSIDEEEKKIFSEIYQTLLEGYYAEHADPYFILHDLRSYYERQKKAEELFKNPLQWAEYALYNMAGMGPFSTDNTIHSYAKEIWNINPCPTDEGILSKMKKEFTEQLLFQ